MQENQEFDARKMSKSYDIQIVKGTASKPTCTAREIYFGGDDFEEIRETVTTVSTVTIKPGSVRLGELSSDLVIRSSLRSVFLPLFRNQV